jgi:thiol:disulfide interchange protein
MKRFLLNTFVVLAIASTLYFANHSLQSYLGMQAQQALSFEVHDLEQGLKVAEQKQQLIIADYSAVWCPSCRKLDQQVFADPDVANVIAENFSFVSVDHDSELGRAFAQRFNLVGFPRVLVLTQSGELVTELPLSFDAAQYKANLNKVLRVSSPHSSS